MSLMQIVGGTVFDAVHGEVIRNGVVCIEDNRITAVGPASAIATGGRDVQVIDAAGQFVMPGMMDCHVHLLSSTAEALMATTRVAADAIGISEHAGTLGAGKWADVVLVQGDPLADIRVLQEAEHITCVIKAGKVVKGTAPGIPMAARR
jgi:imidazolonepropionase-like amidohydrolase